MLSAHEVHIGNPQHASQLVSRHLHWSGRIGLTRLRLRKCRGHRRVKRHIAFHLLHDLVNVPVQYRNGSKLLQITERLRAVIRSPSPLRVHRPQRNVRKNHNGVLDFKCFTSSSSHSSCSLPRFPRPPAFRFTTFTSPTKCTPFLSKLYQPSPLVPLP